MTAQNNLLFSQWPTASFAWYSRETSGGKRRLIAEPNSAMRALHRCLMTLLMRQTRPNFRHTYGAMRGSSPIRNALQHRASRYFYIVDIKAAYMCVDIERLATALSREQKYPIGAEKDILVFLERYCMGKGGGLAVGAPASPLLFNIYCALLLDPYIGYTIGVPYTRYLDDLVVSAHVPISASKRKEIRYALERTGFEVNHRKSRVLDRTRGPVTITGVQILPNGKIMPTSEYMAKFWAECRSVTHDPEHPRDRLHGLFGHLSSFPDDVAAENVLTAKRAYRTLCPRAAYEYSDAYGGVRRNRGKRVEIEVIDTIKAIDIASVIAQYVALKKRASGEYIGLCPFHREKTPSFTVAVHKGFYHCFGCGSHGDIIDFVKYTHGLSFPAAIRWLTENA